MSADEPTPFIVEETSLDSGATLALYGSMSERMFAREAEREAAVQELKASMRATREVKALYRCLDWLNRAALRLRS
jgi:hypothetical protein